MLCDVGWGKAILTADCWLFGLSSGGSGSPNRRYPTVRYISSVAGNRCHIQGLNLRVVTRVAVYLTRGASYAGAKVLSIGK
ncbi:hypothetical protein B0I37DRAFT_359716 [Chaetomium sp. MPI-CAGE-AT-0009]|nr:hypothetical protein B0I37DRAFT_359716 [Chaetomium sp. MPI-CAGE-AT-0009]